MEKPINHAQPEDLEKFLSACLTAWNNSKEKELLDTGVSFQVVADAIYTGLFPSTTCMTEPDYQPRCDDFHSDFSSLVLRGPWIFGCLNTGPETLRTGMLVQMASSGKLAANLEAILSVRMRDMEYEPPTSEHIRFSEDRPIYLFRGCTSDFFGVKTLFNKVVQFISCADDAQLASMPHTVSFLLNIAESRPSIHPQDLLPTGLKIKFLDAPTSGSTIGSKRSLYEDSPSPVYSPCAPAYAPSSPSYAPTRATGSRAPDSVENLVTGGSQGEFSSDSSGKIRYMFIHKPFDILEAEPSVQSMIGTSRMFKHRAEKVLKLRVA